MPVLISVHAHAWTSPQMQHLCIYTRLYSMVYFAIQQIKRNMPQLEPTGTVNPGTYYVVRPYACIQYIVCLCACSLKLKVCWASNFKQMWAKYTNEKHKTRALLHCLCFFLWLGWSRYLKQISVPLKLIGVCKTTLRKLRTNKWSLLTGIVIKWIPEQYWTRMNPKNQNSHKIWNLNS